MYVLEKVKTRGAMYNEIVIKTEYLFICNREGRDVVFAIKKIATTNCFIKNYIH